MSVVIGREEATRIVRCLYEEARRNSGNDNAYDDRAEQSISVSFDRAKELVEAMESELRWRVGDEQQP